MHAVNSYAWLLFGLSGSLSHSASPRTRADPSKEHFGQNPNAHQLFAAPPTNGRVIDRTGWTVTCDSFEPGNECSKAIDGDNTTLWHTQYTSWSPPPPHTITLDMGSTHNVNGLSVLPRQDNNRYSNMARHEISVSPDGTDWEVVAVGNWAMDALTKYANFETRKVRYTQVKAWTEVEGNPWTSIAELQVFDAGVEPTQYAGSSFDRVFTSVWDPATNDVEPKIIDNTDHDMFCPGISIDGTGQVIVTGGNSKYKTTFYDFPSQNWIAGPNIESLHNPTVCLYSSYPIH